VYHPPGPTALLTSPPRAVGPAAVFVALVLTQALLLVWGGKGVSNGSALQQLAAVLLAAGLGAVAVLWVAWDRRFGLWRWHWIFGLALLLRLLAIQSYPLLEDDHYRYLWDGMRTATALDPYRLPPAAFFGDSTLAPVWQNVLSGINHPDVPTLYGPVLQMLFALAYVIAPADVGAIKFILLALDMTMLGLLARFGAGRPAVLILAIHPLVLKEAMASAHPDGIVALLLLLSCLAWQRRHPTWMGALLALAVCTKVAALVVLPLMLLRPMEPKQSPASAQAAAWGGWVLSALAGFGVTLVALYAPFAGRGGSELAGLSTFADQWRFNPLLYSLIAAVTPAQAARPVTAVVLMMMLSGIAWHWRLTAQRSPQPKLPTPPPMDQALLWLLLLSPVVNAWYWLWLLALSLHRQQAWLAVAVCFAPLAYFNSTVLSQAGLGAGHLPPTPFTVLWPASVLQVLALVAALYWRQRLQLRYAARPSTINDVNR
jgi:hypothetical protein